MKKSLLIIVDMVNGFINCGVMHDRHIGKIVPTCRDYLMMFLNHQQDVIAFVDAHNENDQEFNKYPIHCLAGSYESELVDELKLYREHIRVFPKDSTDGLVAESFKDFRTGLRNYDEIVIIGCCTDICVLQLANGLLKDKNDLKLNYQIIVPIDGCETFDTPEHSRIIYNQSALLEMKNKGILVVEEYNYE